MFFIGTVRWCTRLSRAVFLPFTISIAYPGIMDQRSVSMSEFPLLSRLPPRQDCTSDSLLDGFCDYVAEKLKESGIKPLGIEGDLGSDWVLLDLGDVIVHAMNAQARGFYQLEKLWSVDDSKESEQQLG